jgi:hypothetical protein
MSSLLAVRFGHLRGIDALQADALFHTPTSQIIGCGGGHAMRVLDWWRFQSKRLSWAEGTPTCVCVCVCVCVFVPNMIWKRTFQFHSPRLTWANRLPPRSKNCKRKNSFQRKRSGCVATPGLEGCSSMTGNSIRRDGSHGPRRICFSCSPSGFEEVVAQILGSILELIPLVFGHRSEDIGREPEEC